ncbi:GNAT family N-acetyltransferase [Uliginosibacterium sp. 31-16]|uniref:GNAT family N-acetyltransferase n=1 Tax=Uliginosibacterium sp. 31-16 TaxID=3068315 RepID=UPI00273E95F6|nr:GNAT family N-acetyltransferase [Uliginosibacterium sp. 31-16]MDP5239361.1 GNAT family N-acetyltransferase [Uliginosibacterium sp. 31-16]
MRTTLAFQVCRSQDAEALVTLRIAAMRPSLEKAGRFDAQRARERFLAGFQSEHTQWILCDGQVAGFLVVKPQADTLLLDHLYIHPDFQNRQLGATALQHVFARADAANLPVRVGALRGSDSNHFYQRHGFVQCDETEWDIYYLRQPQSAR